MSNDHDLSGNPALLGRAHEHLFVKGENPAEFYALLKSLFEQYTPDSLQDQALVEDAAIARWHFWRRQRVVNRIDAGLYTKESDPANWMTNDFKASQILQCFKHSTEVSCRSAYSTLEATRKENLRNHRWELSYNLQKQRLELAQRKYDDLAPKIQARAKLAAIKANKSIEVELSHERYLACHGYKRPSIVQKVSVTVVDGVTKTVKRPNNRDVMAELAERSLHLFPPEQVVREFVFNGPIPREYDWLVADDDYRGAADFVQSITLEDWPKMIAVETTHCIPGPPDPS